MIQIESKKNCSGCKACFNACNFRAISFVADNEGFIYPDIDKNKCVDCKACERACPYYDVNHGISEDNYTFESIFYAAQKINKKELFYSSSGGVFPALAEMILSGGGVVYGVKQEDVDIISHIRIDNKADLPLILRSKYFQSDINDTLSQCKKDLLDNKTVLFSGTGCQIAGLLCFLEKRYPQLVTCEVVCHGVPSGMVWKYYRHEKEERVEKKIKDLVFRDKSKGWRKNQYKIVFDDGSIEYERITKQLYHRGYTLGFYSRPSCGVCPFASLPRVADITLADFWKYEGKWNKGDLGVSLVGVNNSKGKDFFLSCSDLVRIERIRKEDALDSCRHLNNAPVENENRSLFFETMFNEGFYAAAKKYIPEYETIQKKIFRKLHLEKIVK